jgi:hypothetical protein
MVLLVAVVRRFRSKVTAFTSSEAVRALGHIATKLIRILLSLFAIAGTYYSTANAAIAGIVTVKRVTRQAYAAVEWVLGPYQAVVDALIPVDPKFTPELSADLAHLEVKYEACTDGNHISVIYKDGDRVGYIDSQTQVKPDGDKESRSLEMAIPGSILRPSPENANTKYEVLVLSHDRSMLGLGAIFSRNGEVTVFMPAHVYHNGATYLRGSAGSLLISDMQVTFSKVPEADIVYLTSRGITNLGTKAVTTVVPARNDVGVTIVATNTSGKVVTSSGAIAGVDLSGSPLTVLHTASTLPGFSGALVRNSGSVCGMHVSSVMTKEGHYNVFLDLFIIFMIDGLLPRPRSSAYVSPRGGVLAVSLTDGVRVSESSEGSRDAVHKLEDYLNQDLLVSGKHYKFDPDTNNFSVFVKGSQVAFVGDSEFEEIRLEYYEDLAHNQGITLNELLEMTEIRDRFNAGKFVTQGEVVSMISGGNARRRRLYESADPKTRDTVVGDDYDGPILVEHQVTNVYSDFRHSGARSTPPQPNRSQDSQGTKLVMTLRRRTRKPKSVTSESSSKDAHTTAGGKTLPNATR